MAPHACVPESKSLTPENGTRCEIKALDERVSESGPELIEKPGQPYDTKLTKPFMDYALITTRTFDEKHKHIMTTLQINSRPLLGVLKNIVKCYPSFPEHFDEPVSIEAPFPVLYHHLEDLIQYKETTEDDDARMQIQLLLNYLDTELGESIAKTKRLVAAGCITFPLLWTIFRPGDLIYEGENGHPRLYRLQKTVYDENIRMGKFMRLTFSYTDCDRGNPGRAQTEVIIYEKLEFRGPAKIDSLSVYPLRFMRGSSQEDLKATLTKRGKGFLEFQAMQVVQYKGLFLGLKSPPREFYDYEVPISQYDGVWLPHTGNGRVVIDNDSFYAEHESQKAHVGLNREQDDIFLPKCAIDPGPPDDLMLCPSYVYGFSLARKVWCKFFIDNIKHLEWNPNAFDSLVLPQRYKAVVRSLVNSHKFPGQNREAVDPKGKGLVILLHGTPGSGKTLTAETAAEHAKRPLIIVSSGELGEWKNELEFELKRILDLATTWEAVVLIDEADVYLEERAATSDKMDRNGLVAVFLRELEYFQGIIFMTSNRVDVFDPAIKSRIHLALEYTPPGPDVRAGIWKRSLNMIPSDEVEFNLEKLLGAVQKLEMNGREISNTMNTARTLARDLKEKLSLGHIESIVQIWLDFQVATKKEDPKTWWSRVSSFLFLS